MKLLLYSLKELYFSRCGYRVGSIGRPLILTLSQVSYSSSGIMKLLLYSLKELYFSVSGYRVGSPGRPLIQLGGSALRSLSR